MEFCAHVKKNVYKLAALGKYRDIEVALQKEGGRANECFNGSSPLHAACFNGHYETVNLLLSHGAHVEAKDSLGSTPLHIACAKNRDRIVFILLKEGANVDAEDNMGRYFYNYIKCCYVLIYKLNFKGRDPYS
jgi:hypothetical protein